MKDWSIAGAKIQGIQHKKKNIPCQDAFKLIEKDYFFCSAVSDGAGSSKYAEIASEIVVNRITKILEESFDSFFTAPNNEVKEKIIHRIRTKLGIAAKNKKASINDFNSTLLFVAIKNKNYIVGHIGDGAIGALVENNLKTFSEPLNGEHKNQTYFLTTNGYKKHFRIYKGELKNISGFILATDGTTDSLYNYGTNKFAEIGIKIIKWLDENDKEKVNKAIEENLINVISKKTGDDCTLLIMRKIKSANNVYKK